MNMRLYHSPTSPFVRKVMVVLHETGLINQVELVPTQGTPLDPETKPLARNPLGKIPTLERADGPALYDSRVICRYFAEMAGGALYPQARIWETLTLEATADGVMEAALLIVYEDRLRPDGERSVAWKDAQWSKVDRALDAVETRWMAHLAAPLDCGQIALGCALGYLDLRMGDRGWRASYPALATWADRFGSRASMRETAPAG